VSKGSRGRPKGSVGRAAILSSAQIKEAFRSARRNGRYADRAEIALILSIELGLRATELALLKQADVYQLSGSVHEKIAVRRAYLRGSQALVEVARAPRLRGLLSDYREKQMASFDHCDQNDPLFRSQRGGHMTGASMTRYLTGLYRNAGILTASSRSGRRTLLSGIPYLSSPENEGR
jgi:integrase/recombinase XerD